MAPTVPLNGAGKHSMRGFKLCIPVQIQSLGLAVGSKLQVRARYMVMQLWNRSATRTDAFLPGVLTVTSDSGDFEIESADGMGTEEFLSIAPRTECKWHQVQFSLDGSAWYDFLPESWRDADRTLMIPVNYAGRGGKPMR
jgi:hypothetical protein